MALDRKKKRVRKKKAIRSKVRGTNERPRMSVFKSNTQIYVQVIDDEQGITLCSASTLDSTIKEKDKAKCNIENAKKVGQLISDRAKEKNISSVIFDRNGYRFHGRVKAIAEACQESGLLPNSRERKKV